MTTLETLQKVAKSYSNISVEKNSHKVKKSYYEGMALRPSWPVEFYVIKSKNKQSIDKQEIHKMIFKHLLEDVASSTLTVPSVEVRTRGPRLK